jgi:tetratricopeptide (TPR) repeat protein
MVGRYGEALQQIRLEQERLARRRLPVSRPLVQEAFLLSRIGRYKEAQRRLDDAAELATLERRPSDFISAHLLLALLWLERDEAALARTHISAAEGALDRIAADERHWLAREGRMVVNFAAGMTELHSGRLPAARQRLARLERDHRANEPAERWWYHTLRGEIAFAVGALDKAEEAFRSAESLQPVDYGWGFERGPFLHTFRGGLARTLEQRGNLSAAVTFYRQILTPSQGHQWRAVLEPRLALALGKTLGRCGDRDTSRAELRWFLDLWQDADPDLPELDEARRMVMRSRPQSGATSPHCTG